MPKSVPTPRKFLELAARPDAKWVKVKKCGGEVTKFKLRTTKYLYTLTVKHKYSDGREVTPDTEEPKKYLEEYTV